MSVRVAVVDSGINPDHPHVGEVRGGIFIHPDGESADYTDRIGHGTAVAGAIREKSPAAELYAVRIFDQRLTASIDILMRGLGWCLANGIQVVNLSVGTANERHRARLLDFVSRACLREMFIVSASGMLPGMIEGAIGVDADPECDRETCRFRDGVFLASPYPRAIPGVPPQFNLNGTSFAIANVTGLLARILEATKPSDAYRELATINSSSRPFSL
jgi:hypothetical protein